MQLSVFSNEIGGANPAAVAARTRAYGLRSVHRPELPGPGRGVLDYPLYIRLLREHGYDGPLIMEHLSEAEVPAAIDFLNGMLAGYS